MLLTLTSDSIEASVCCCPFSIPPSPSISLFPFYLLFRPRLWQMSSETRRPTVHGNDLAGQGWIAVWIREWISMWSCLLHGHRERERKGGCRERGPVKHCSGGTCRGCHYVKLDAVKCCALSLLLALPLLRFLSATHSPPPSNSSPCLSPSCSAFNAYKLRWFQNPSWNLSRLVDHCIFNAHNAMGRVEERKGGKQPDTERGREGGGTAREQLNIWGK